MIQHWRDEWKQGDIPIYWVQLTDFMAEKPEPGDSSWAELRESQTKTQNAIKNGGQAVIIDIGEGRDIHTRNKRDVADRLVRLALAKDYGVKIPFRSPEYKSVEIQGNKAIVTLDTFDVTELKGLAVCGVEKKGSGPPASSSEPTRLKSPPPASPRPSLCAMRGATIRCAISSAKKACPSHPSARTTSR